MLCCGVNASAAQPGSSPVRLAITGATGFFVMGVLVSVLGPTLPEMRARHGLGGTGAALLLAAYSVGSAVGVVVAGRGRHRVRVERLLTGGAVALAVGCASVPAAPNGIVLAAALFLAGVGLGILDLLLNVMVARGFGSGGGGVLSALSAVFGVSAVLTPLVVGRAPDDLVLPYLLCAAGATTLVILTTRLRAAQTRPPAERRASQAELRTILLLSAVLLGYVALESGVASWETTHLRAATSLSDSATAQAVALFWLGLTVGRVATVPMALRWQPGPIVVTSLVLSTAAVAVAAHAPYAVAAYAVTGFVVAPVFPAVITWHARAVPSGRGATRIFAAGLAGPVLGAPLLGIASDASSARAIPWVLAAIAFATTLTALACVRHAVGMRPAD